MNTNERILGHGWETLAGRHVEDEGEESLLSILAGRELDENGPSICHGRTVDLSAHGL